MKFMTLFSPDLSLEITTVANCFLGFENNQVLVFPISRIPFPWRCPRHKCHNITHKATWLLLLLVRSDRCTYGKC